MRLSIVIFVLLIFFVNHTFAQKKSNEKQLIQKYKQLNINNYTQDKLHKKISKTLKGNSVNLIPIQKLSVLPKSNMYAFKKIWSKSDILWPNVIVLSNGIYDLKTIHSILKDKKIIQKIGKNNYLIKLPIYISPTATLIIKKTTLKLSLEHGAFISYHGNLDIVDAKITSWNIKEQNYGPRKILHKSKILMHSKQSPRPFIQGLEGSYTNILNSDIIGLGFKGPTGMYGISLLKRGFDKKHQGTLNTFLRSRAEPSATIVGNNISKCFFGFYSTNVKDVFLVGNLFYDNIIYSIDPHDYSENLTIARNITHSARYAHGIIFSRVVDNSVIAENITFLNQGSGIMLDRDCENSLIYKNISFENGTDGIAIMESDHNIISNNIILQNNHNGIYIRNSSNISVHQNYIYHNALNGAEISVVNIDKLETRNFILDPYHQKAKAYFIKNYFEKNINSALSVKNNAELFFQHNTLKNSGPLYFSGEIEKYTLDILTSNSKQGFLLSDKKVTNP